MASSVISKVPNTWSQSSIAYTLGVKTFVFSDSDFTKAREYFAIIGRAQSFAPSQDKTLTAVYEINTVSAGERVEIVPGGIPADSIAITRIETYRLPFLASFGALEANNLRSQIFPFTMVEYVFNPKDIKQSIAIEYINCFFDSFSDPIEMTDGGGGPINISANIQVSSRRVLHFLGNSTDANATSSAEWISFKVRSAFKNSFFQRDIDVAGGFAQINPTIFAALGNIASTDN